MKNTLKFLSCIIAAVIISIGSYASPGVKPAKANRAPLSFIENKGQVTDQNQRARPDIQFQLKAAGGLTIFVGDGAIHYQFSKPDRVVKQPSKEEMMKPGFVAEEVTFTMDRMDVELVGANKSAQVITEHKQDYYENYYKEWSGGKTVSAAAYDRITYKNIYPNIDWVLFTNDGKLEHEFVVRPGGKVSDIKLKYGGAKELKINADGGLTATTPQGTITEHAPVTYQKDGTKVISSFVLNGNILSYSTGSYMGELVIDPTLLWATYFGGAAEDQGGDLSIDAAGNAYLTGHTYSVVGIATSGAYDVSLGGSVDAFLVKYNSAGVLMWATYYGGSLYDAGYAVTTDVSGNVIMAGATTSGFGGGTDCFVAKFDGTGSLVWGTYFGGTGEEFAVGISSDLSGNIFIAGNTTSVSGIATSGTYQTLIASGDDAFIAKFNSSGTLLWGTYYGGPNSEGPSGVYADVSGNVFICGRTNSATGIATSGAYSTTLASTNDAYIAKFNGSGTTLLWGTYYGGEDDEAINRIVTDGAGNIYAAGSTLSLTGIATAGAHQTINSGGYYDGMLLKFNSSGVRQWATYYGGSNLDFLSSMTIDGTGNVFIGGLTSSTSGIASLGAYQPSFGGGFSDFFFAEFNGAGVRQYSTYYGGNDDDQVHGMAIDGSGNIYMGGYTATSFGIVTAGASQTTFGGGFDGFVLKFNVSCPAPVVAAITGPTTVCPGGTITLADATSGGTWSSSNTGVATVGSTGVVVGVSAGNAVITYGVTNSCGTTNVMALINVGSLVINTIAGNGTAGFSGDGGQALAAKIQGPSGTVKDAAGNIYFSDYYNNRIRKISTSGIITTVAGTGTVGYSGDGGAATAALLQTPSGIGVDPAGNIYWAEYLNNVIRKLTVSTGIISTVAGNGTGGYFGDGGPASLSILHHPPAVYVDPVGNIYVPDAANARIRKIDLAGNINTIAGNGVTGFSGDGGPATNAQLSNSFGICVDGTGNVFIADQINYRVRKIDLSGIITTIAGTGVAGYSGDGGAATSAKLNGPTGVIADPNGNILVADRQNNCVRKITTATGIITTVIGTGTAGFSGDGGAATIATLNNVPLIYMDAAYNIYISDFNNNRIRKVAPVGTAIVAPLTTLCQGIPVLFTDSTAGGTWSSSNPAVATVGSISGEVTGVAAGTATISYAINFSCGLSYVLKPITVNAFTAGTISGANVVCPGNTITLTDATSGGTWSSSNTAVGTVAGGIVTGITTGNTIISYTVTNSCGTIAAMQNVTVGNPVITTFAGTGTSGYGAEGGLATATAMSTPIHTAIDAAGNIYYSDYTNSRVRKISPAGIVTNVAGNGVVGYSGDGFPATSAALRNPAGIALDVAGNLYITDYQGYEIRKVNTSGIISTIAGTGVLGLGADGIPATASAINHCWGVTTDASGNVYFSDRYNHNIRKINSSGIVSTIAGTGTAGYSGDGGPATAAKLNEPLDLVFDRAGNLLITEGVNNIVRKISPNGIISTVAGNGVAGFGGDGGPATSGSVQFNVPVGICLDSAGNIYIGDYSNNRVRKISPAGIISTVAGTGTASYNGDGIAPTTANLRNPQCVAVYGTGNLYICDASNYRIRKIRPADASVAAITGPSSVCVGATIPLADITAGGSWSSSIPGVATVGSTGIVTGVSAGVTTISYSVVMSCGTMYAFYPVTVAPLPAAPAAITGSTTICVGSTNTLSDATPGGAWTSTVSTVATVPTAAGNVTGISLGTSTISYTISNSCGINAATVNVTVVAAPGPITGTLSACAGSSSLLSDGGGGTWTSSATAVATVGSSTGLVSALTPGTTTITYTLSGVCTTTAIFTVNAVPAAITPAGAVSICEGATASLADATPGGTWSSALTTTATVGSTGIVTGVTAGTVNILYTTGLGCVATKSVTVLPTPAALSPSSASVCVGSTTTFTESVSGGVWSSVVPATASVVGGVVTGVAAGTTSISYSIGTCAVGAPVTVNLTPAAITPASAVTMCVGATASLGDVTPGGTWSSAATGTATVGSTGIVTGVAAGTVNILYTTGAGCSATKSVTVLPTPVALSPTSAIVCTGNTVTFSESVSGGVWSSTAPGIASVAGGVVTGLAVGTANISYTIGTCAVGAPVTVNLSPNAGVIVGPSTLCTGSPITYTDAAVGGVWSSGNPAIATISGTGLATGISSGVVTLSYDVTNSCGTATATKVVTVTSSASAGTIIGTTLVCAGLSTAYIDTLTGGTWSVTNGNATISGSGVLLALTPGIDTVLYTVINACGPASSMKIVTIGLPLSAGSISGPGAVCTGSSITLTETIAGGVWSSSNASATVVGGVVTGVTAGVDTISYTVTSGCGSVVATHIVTVNFVPTTGATSGPSILCAGFTATYTNPTAGGVWSVTNINATISSSGFLNALLPGNDTIRYTIANTCGTSVATAYVTIGAAISAGAISGPGSVCVGGTITLTDPASGGVWISSNSSATVIGGVVTGVTAGIDTIYYSVTASCGSVMTSWLVTVNPSAVAATITGPAALCIGSIGTYTDAVPGGTWSLSNGNATVTSGGVVTPLTVGADTLYYTVAGTCGTSVANQVINIGIMPVAGTISGAANICIGSSVTLTDPVPGGTWIASNTNATVVGGVVTGVSAGLVTISYSVSSSCGTAVATYPMDINSIPSPGVITGPTSVCVGSLIALADTALGGAWSASNTSATISLAGIVTGIAPGMDTISYTVTNACGSFSTSHIVSVSVTASAGTITGPTLVCAGGTITLTDAVSGGVWGVSNSHATISTGGVVTGVSPGTDTVMYTVTTACGTATATYIISIGAAVSAGAISGPSNVCVASTITLTDPVTGGTWSSGSANATVAGGVVTGVTAGTATISYTVSGSCGTVSATKVVTVSVAPTVSAISGPTGVCAGATITLVDATPGGVWSATNARATVAGGVVTGVSAGMDTIRYSVTNACGTAMATWPISINSLPSAGSVSGPAEVCPAGTVTLVHSASGGTWSSSNSGVATVSGAGVVTGVTSGVATISYTVTNSCGHASATHGITVLTPSLCGGGTLVGGPASNGREALSVVPNPNNGRFTVQLSSSVDDQVHVVITNIIGQKVKEFNTVTNNIAEVQLGDVAGIYLISVSTKTATHVAKVIIN